ncbi:DedA family protein [Candidatus Fokinia crypta]|uniref:DedA family membrane protein n=1 Tax=Candidatus Fokinia crypta TaxID=1920990 RepID=A0ABZ0UQ23_9RICK|nr:DedA family protein [Candidatus Fokinia cryptica]WPX97804.1 Putative DedA family membrane protein [Candidatus Fokinia cryptica]
MLLIKNLGYVGIFITSVIEGTLIPIPNEITMIPAGYLAAQDVFSLPLILISGISGNFCGAFISYYVSYRYGAKFIEKYGRYFFISENAMSKVEKFFREYGRVSVFIGRIMPGVKHFISIPAGLSRMPIGVFCLYSGVGGGIWVTTLVLIGYLMGDNATLIAKYFGYLNYVIIFMTVGVAFYILRKPLRGALVIVKEKISTTLKRKL